jgi:molybdopterin-guanine dinucleotide biosynthesis protein A
MAATVAVLAGGRGTRIGGDKALTQLNGRALIEYPLHSARGARLDACVVAKRETRLPPLNVPILVEPDHPVHPLSGIVTALRHHPTVIALPCDMPLVPPSVLARLAASKAQLMLAAPGEPFPALYAHSTLPVLERALAEEASLRSVLRTLAAPSLVGVDPSVLFSVNSSEDLDVARHRVQAKYEASNSEHEASHD